MRPTVMGLTLLMVGICSGVNVAQTLRPRPPGGTQQDLDMPAGQAEQKSADDVPITMPMNVEAGTPIKVAIDSEVRIRSVGQTIHGRTTEPVYAFDKLLIPVGTVVNGKVAAIDPVPKMARTMQAADGNFSPERKVHVQDPSFSSTSPPGLWDYDTLVEGYLEEGYWSDTYLVMAQLPGVNQV